ncbi:MAG: type VI secretion system tube protein Hcp [Desulfobacteraceae bacterium]|nr:type VI secretion system tube protein Hcp [Desulfobacteraceae bacterium]
MSSDVLVKFTNVDGESTEDNYKTWIKVESWSHGFTQTGTPTKGAHGPTLGRANIDDFSFTKMTDKSTTALAGLCLAGSLIDDVSFVCLDADGDNNAFEALKIELTDVVITNLSIGGGSGSGSVENVSLSFSKVKYTYDHMDKETSKSSGKKIFTHDLKTGKTDK